jgi:hypothetical protein
LTFKCCFNVDFFVNKYNTRASIWQAPNQRDVWKKIGKEHLHNEPLKKEIFDLQYVLLKYKKNRTCLQTESFFYPLFFSTLINVPKYKNPFPCIFKCPIIILVPKRGKRFLRNDIFFQSKSHGWKNWFGKDKKFSELDTRSF